MYKLPMDTVYLLSTCALCDSLNSAMLTRIPCAEIQLIARDTVNCASYMKKRVSKILGNGEEGNSRTAVLLKVIIVKIGAKIIIRRNVDVTLGLVNGTITTVVAVQPNVDANDCESINVYTFRSKTFDRTYGF